MQPVRDVPPGRSLLPGLPSSVPPKPSFVDSQSTQLNFASGGQAVDQASFDKAMAEKDKGRWWRPLVAMAAAGAAGVGVALGIGALAPALSPLVVSGATAVAGAGTYFLAQKLLQPKSTLPPATSQEEFDKAQAAKNTKAWWKSGVLALGALLATGALGIGVDMGLKALLSPTMASTIQTAISPALWGFTNAIAGAVTFLFIQKVTEPVGAFISRWSAKGSPIQSTHTPEIFKSFIDINEGANAVNSLALSGAISVNSLKNQLQDTIRDARLFIDSASLSWDADEAAAKIKQAGSMLGRTLIATETLNFSVTPDFPGVMKLLHEALGAYFEDLPEATRNELIAAAIEAVKARRPAPADPRIPTTEAAIKAYYLPMLEGVINGKVAVQNVSH
ncbi:MAG: hypothetical protein ACAI38_01875 [Myxococcota bacterium]|nr:hypothetical protein [Myxococcota bacterium]